MTSSINLKKLVSIGAAMLLAVGGSLVAAQPASAVGGPSMGAGQPIFSVSSGGYNLGDVLTVDYRGVTYSPAADNFTYVWKLCTVEWAMNGTCSGTESTIQTTSASSAAYDTYALQAGDFGKYIKVATTAYSGLTAGSTYTQQSSFQLILIPTQTSAPVLPTADIAIGATVSLSDAGGAIGQWSSRSGVTTQWFVCRSEHATAILSSLGGSFPSDCKQLFTGTTSNSFVSGSSVNLSTAVNKFVSNTIVQGMPTLTVASLDSQDVWLLARDYFSYNSFMASATKRIGPVPVVSTTTTDPVATVTEAAKPLPVWAAPILKQVPTLSKTLTTEGGKLSLTDGDFSSLKSVTVGGKEVAYSIDAKGDVNIPVPAGKGGTTADLVIVFTGGKMTVQDGIKYVEPTNVAAVREAPIAGFKGNSTKITGALAESIQYAAQLDKKANTVLCTGYATSKAAVATATARAEAACGYATKVNDLLVNKKVTIVVNAKLAKTTAVGIKVYK